MNDTHRTNSTASDPAGEDDATESTRRPQAMASSTTDPLVGTQRRTDDPLEARHTPESEVRMATDSLGPTVKSRRVAVLLAICLGAFGSHRLYLGYRNVGLFQMALFVGGFGVVIGVAMFNGAPLHQAALSALAFVAVVPIWAAAEGVMILLGALNRDAHGRPLAA